MEGSYAPGQTPSRVTVRFEPKGPDTEVIVIHERIAGEPTRQSHEAGWLGCLEALSEWAALPPP